jgi:penicillin-binding protein 1A
LAAVLFPLIGSLYLNTLPSVDDAEARVEAILRVHHGKAASLLLTTKVGQAVIAVEDERFLSHHGIDTLGLIRAASSTLTGQGVEGGSTITQQLAKALYVTDDHTLATKLPLMGVAIKLEQRYSKAQILDMYLNSIYFGDGQWGIAQASQTFFGKAPQALDWAEASLLAGLPQAPSSYDPTRHWELARLRQHHVLDRLVETGVLSRAQADAAYRELTHLGQ